MDVSAYPLFITQTTVVHLAIDCQISEYVLIAAIAILLQGEAQLQLEVEVRKMLKAQSIFKTCCLCSKFRLSLDPMTYLVDFE